MDTWNIELIDILNKIRINSITLSNKHRIIALHYQSISKWFDLPIIVCSTFSSSVGSITYMPSEDKAQINLFISMFITILSSFKLYLNITSNLNNKILLSREFYILSIDIYKNLNLRVENRPNGNDFLNECYSNYIKLCEKSTLTHKMKRDELLKIDKDDNESLNTISTNNSFNDFKNIIHSEKYEC
jgi:hypothetical protein